MIYRQGNYEISYIHHCRRPMLALFMFVVAGISRHTGQAHIAIVWHMAGPAAPTGQTACLCGILFSNLWEHFPRYSTTNLANIIIPTEPSNHGQPST